MKCVIVRALLVGVSHAVGVEHLAHVAGAGHLDRVVPLLDDLACALEGRIPAVELPSFAEGRKADLLRDLDKPLG